mgnify:CR=1 FL=1|jgi:hypothetical protein
MKRSDIFSGKLATTRLPCGDLAVGALWNATNGKVFLYSKSGCVNNIMSRWGVTHKTQVMEATSDLTSLIVTAAKIPLTPTNIRDGMSVEAIIGDVNVGPAIIHVADSGVAWVCHDNSERSGNKSPNLKGHSHSWRLSSGLGSDGTYLHDSVEEINIVGITPSTSLLSLFPSLPPPEVEMAIPVAAPKSPRKPSRGVAEGAVAFLGVIKDKIPKDLLGDYRDVVKRLKEVE